MQVSRAYAAAVECKMLNIFWGHDVEFVSEWPPRLSGSQCPGVYTTTPALLATVDRPHITLGLGIANDLIKSSDNNNIMSSTIAPRPCLTPSSEYAYFIYGRPPSPTAYDSRNNSGSNDED